MRSQNNSQTFRIKILQRVWTNYSRHHGKGIQSDGQNKKRLKQRIPSPKNNYFSKMCEKRKHNRIDKCMRKMISRLQEYGVKTLACCCGHGKYPRTIVIRAQGYPYEIFSDTIIPRIAKFYKLDKKLGIYYIPEVMEKRKKDGWPLA